MSMPLEKIVDYSQVENINFKAGAYLGNIIDK